MPRRYRPPRRTVAADEKYNSELVARFINRLMLGGKKSVAARIMYDAFDIMEERTHKNPLEVFQQAVENATPGVEVTDGRETGRRTDGCRPEHWCHR